MKNSSIAVIGAGSWGTALASVLSFKGYRTLLWGHEAQHVENLINDRQNLKYLPDFIFNENIFPESDIEKTVKNCPVVCMVVPSQFYRSSFKRLIEFVDNDVVIVSAVKGIENDSLMTMTEVMEEELSRSNRDYGSMQLAVLSGPSFAREVADKMPTAVTIGCRNIDTAKKLQNIFVTDYFRTYASGDIIGLEISAAFKNIIAIATGICDGLGFGLNARAALITRGLAEISRFGIQRGADPLTFSGLSGMGDLILTCTGDLSRNRTVGIKLGQGKKLANILKEMNMVAEGVKTTLSGYRLAQKLKIEMPILEQVYKILYEQKEPRRAVQDLLSRDLKAE